MKKLIYIILFCPLITLGQSPQATRLFDFDFEKEIITIDTVIRFEGLSKKEIIDLSYSWLIDALKYSTYANEMKSDDRIVGKGSFPAFGIVGDPTEFKITILAKDDRARMLIENIVSAYPGDPNALGMLPPTKTSAMIYYYYKGKLLTRNAALKTQNKFEMPFINLINSWKKSVTESLVRDDDW